MKKSEFVKWLNEKTTFSEDGIDTWREEVDYANCVWDEVSIDENKVTFSYEEMYWGGSNWINREMTFEEFIEAYEDNSLKY